MTEPATIAFGILTDYMSNYHRQIVQGIQKTLGQSGVGSVVFVGAELRGPPETYFAGANAVYDLVSTQRLGGLIMLSGSMSARITDEELLGFLARYAPLPLVSIGRVVPGVPSVISGNQPGMRALMRHLIEDCGHRRFAFMRGAVGEPDSEARELVFRQSLLAHGLELREEALLTGDYFAPRAYEVTRQWLQRGESADVIVAASDDMAFGILQALEEAGLNVPEDIAVTGYDDLETSQQSLPPLTTVRQPLSELGIQAARLLLEQWRGQTVEPVVDLPSVLVVRESSQATRVNPPTSAHVVPPEQPRPVGLEALRDEFTVALQPAQTGQSFLRAWRNWMRSEEARRQGPTLWQEVLQRLLADISAGLEPDAVRRALSLWGRANALALSEGQLLRQRRSLNEQGGLTWFHDFDVALMSDADIPALTRNVARFLPDLGLARCYIALFETYGQTVCDTAHLVLAFEDGVNLTVDPSPFETRKLLPPSMQQRLRGHLFVQEIFVNDEQYGWMMFEVISNQEFYFESLRQSLSSGIHNAVQAKRLQNYTEFLESRIQERTQELEDANHQLRQENAERRRAEDALRIANAQLRQATLQDGLTGVANRAALDEYLERQLRAQQRHRKPLTFVLCDIDFFKRYNDHYGHLAGDTCLRDVAQAIKQSLMRPEDMVARYGGEEFALVLPNTDLENARNVIDRVRQTLEALRIAHKASPVTAHVTLSMGGISLVPDRSCSAHDLIRTADHGLYEAKAGGRNRVVWKLALHAGTSAETMLRPGT